MIRRLPVLLLSLLSLALFGSSVAPGVAGPVVGLRPTAAPSCRIAAGQTVVHVARPAGTTAVSDAQDVAYLQMPDGAYCMIPAVAGVRVEADLD